MNVLLTMGKDCWRELSPGKLGGWMTNKKYEPKKDKYLRARGGKPQFLNIYCAHCATYIAFYQKDGPGALLRLYLDRIFEPSELAGLQHFATDKAKIPNLVCPSCHQVIGIPIVYAPENRLAFRLNKGSVSKAKSDGRYPPTISSESANEES